MKAKYLILDDQNIQYGDVYTNKKKARGDITFNIKRHNTFSIKDLEKLFKEYRINAPFPQSFVQYLDEVIEDRKAEIRFLKSLRVVKFAQS